MKAFGIPAGTPVVRAQAQGTFHRLYEVTPPGRGASFLRISALAGEHPARLMAMECRLMDVLRGKGLPIPACEHRDIAYDRGVQLIERGSGVSMTQLEGDEPRMLQALEWVGGFLARLHRLRGSGFGPLSHGASLAGVHSQWVQYVWLRLPEHVQLCLERGAVSDAEAREIARLADDRLIADAPSALLHGDPGSHNFLVDESGVRAVIDWEDALLGDPLFDIASLCTFHPERRHPAIWAGYGTGPHAGESEWTRFWLYFLRISIAKTVHRYRFSYPDRPDRPPASQRIQLALARLREGAA
jgi:aminoglycoside phosphotransferase (APT) family kinase protein